VKTGQYPENDSSNVRLSPYVIRHRFPALSSWTGERVSAREDPGPIAPPQCCAKSRADVALREPHPEKSVPDFSTLPQGEGENENAPRGFREAHDSRMVISMQHFRKQIHQRAVVTREVIG